MSERPRGALAHVVAAYLFAKARSEYRMKRDAELRALATANRGEG